MGSNARLMMEAICSSQTVSTYMSSAVTTQKINIPSYLIILLNWIGNMTSNKAKR
jgi:hypothetical protein